jgi:DNA-binding response OmpR family regulator
VRLLIVEDSRPLRESLRKGLLGAGFAVDATGDGAEGLALARANPYDLLVLDLMVPGLDGWQVLDRLRDRESRPHVLVLTARDGVSDRVRGLDAGADDYLVKPFHFDELLARLRALVRRRYAERSPTVDVDGLCIDLNARTACYRDAPLDLSAREYALLEYLALRRGQVVSREEIEDHIYGVNRLPASNAVDSTVCILRSKIGPAGKQLLRTRRGRGYQLGTDA